MGSISQDQKISVGGKFPARIYRGKTELVIAVLPRLSRYYRGKTESKKKPWLVLPWYYPGFNVGYSAKKQNMVIPWYYRGITMVKPLGNTAVKNITGVVLPGQHDIFGTDFLEFHLVLPTR